MTGDWLQGSWAMRDEEDSAVKGLVILPCPDLRRLSRRLGRLMEAAQGNGPHGVSGSARLVCKKVEESGLSS